MILRKLVAGMAIAASATIGFAGIAGAQSTTPSTATSTSQSARCAKAESLLSAAHKRDAAVNARLTALEARVAQLRQNGHTKRADAFEQAHRDDQEPADDRRGPHRQGAGPGRQGLRRRAEHPDDAGVVTRRGPGRTPGRPGLGRRPRPVEGPEPYLGRDVADRRVLRSIPDGIAVALCDAIAALEHAGRADAVSWRQALVVDRPTLRLVFRRAEGELLPPARPHALPRVGRLRVAGPPCGLSAAEAHRAKRAEVVG